jgi:hypothetical protein
MILFKMTLLKIAFMIVIVVMPFITLAQGNVPAPCDTSGKICNPIPSVTSLPALIQKILEGILKIGFPIIALAIIYSGFLFVSAQGNEEKLNKAKSALLYTLIGAAILLGSWAIAKLISETVLAL